MAPKKVRKERFRVRRKWSFDAQVDGIAPDGRWVPVAELMEVARGDLRFTVTYDGHSTVSVSARVNRAQFDRALAHARAIRAVFRRTRPGSDWGAEGAGYFAQMEDGLLVLHRSGVGPRAFRRGLELLKR